MNKLAALIKAYMQYHDISYHQMARDIGIETSTFWRFVNGRELDGVNFRRILTWCLAEEQNGTCNNNKGSGERS